MNTYSSNRGRFLVAVLMLPLLILVVGCDTGGGLGDETLLEEDFRIDCFRPEGATKMVFEATGAIEDEGFIEGEPLPVAQGVGIWQGTRTLEGRDGVVVLNVGATIRSDGSAHMADGQFIIVEGSGAYRGLEGRGEFSVMLDEQLGLMEIFEGSLGDNF